MGNFGATAIRRFGVVEVRAEKPWGARTRRYGLGEF
jgi:hypothetical protein